LGRSWRDKDPVVKTPLWRTDEGKRKPVFADETFDPMLRLVGRMPFLRSTVWMIVLGWAAVVCINRFWVIPPLRDLFAAKICAFLLKTLVAFQACRFFVEARRSGALELLFCTPLRNADIISAQWRALLRVFLWPLAIFLLLSWANVVYLSDLPAAFPRRPSLDDLANFKPGYLGACFLSIGLAADVLALGWFGMWLALRLNKPGLAPALTIAAVLIAPAPLSYFDLVADMLFISWGTTRFREEIRWQAALPLNRVAVLSR
jgi:hypothetical protein